MTLAADNARQILRAALAADIGIIVDVEASDVMIQPTSRAKQILYRFKQEDYEFKDLTIRFDKDEPDKALRIVKISALVRLGEQLSEADDA
jgi:hypothetical protein